MKRCNNPEFPYCTEWVEDGAKMCAAQHRQSEADAELTLRKDQLLSGGSILSGISQRPHLHISGFDPRAAGGRQTIKIELRGINAAMQMRCTMRLQSELIRGTVATYEVMPSTSGNWCPVMVEFSSKGKEHGQYRMEIELQMKPNLNNSRFICTPVLIVPRPDASLNDIQRVFLSSHKNVKVTVDDASIAKISGAYCDQLDISAKNAAIAEVNFANRHDINVSSIAWDEDLIEVAIDNHAGSRHPHPSEAGCLIVAEAAIPGQSARHIRLFAKQQCILGRVGGTADILLAHYADNGLQDSHLTRRISDRHALIHYRDNSFQIEDISRYGLLIDGNWPGKSQPVTLKAGMKIEMSASFRHLVVLHVSALMPHAIFIERKDQARLIESFWLFAPEKRPQNHEAPPFLPCLYHHRGGFWQLSDETIALTPNARLTPPGHAPGAFLFVGSAYPHSGLT